MKSVKDIKKEIGYVEFILPTNEISIIPIYSIRELKKGIKLETKQHELIDNLLKYSNFHDDNNINLISKKIKYGIILFKKREKKIQFSEIYFGLLKDLIIENNIYRFTLTK